MTRLYCDILDWLVVNLADSRPPGEHSFVVTSELMELGSREGVRKLMMRDGLGCRQGLVTELRKAYYSRL